MSAGWPGIMIPLDDFEAITEMSAQRRVIMVLARHRVVRPRKGSQDRSCEVFDSRRLKPILDWLPILFEQDAPKNVFDQGENIQPFIRSALEAAVVQVIAVDVDARSQRVTVTLLHVV